MTDFLDWLQDRVTEGLRSLALIASAAERLANAAERIAERLERS